MRRITGIVLVAANDVLAARLELSEPRVHAVLRSVLKNGVILGTPVHLSLPLGTQAADLVRVERKGGNLHFLTLGRVAAVGPRVDAGVIETSVLELGAVNRSFCPGLRVRIVGTVVVFNGVGSMKDLLPLEHLNLSFEAIRILGDYAEVTVLQIHLVLGGARYVDQAVLVVPLGSVCIGFDAFLSGFIGQVSVDNLSLLVLP